MRMPNIEIKPLEGKEQWPTWRYKVISCMQMYAGVYEVVEGTNKSPSPVSDEASADQQAKFEKSLGKFTRCQAAARTIIVNGLSTDNLRKVMRFTCPREIWLELHRLFDGLSEDKADSYCQEFFAYQYESGVDIASQIASLQTLWEKLNVELQVLDPKQQKLPDLLLVSRIVQMLPKMYFGFRTSWKMLKQEDKTVENLITRLCAHERDLSSSAGGVSEVQSDALYSKAVPKSKFTGKPSGFNNNRPVTNSNANIKCHYCGKLGHKKDKYFKKKHDSDSTNLSNLVTDYQYLNHT